MTTTYAPTYKMATIVTIDDITPIDGATSIELAHVLGWQCIVKKDTFHIGDTVIYVCIDSIVDVTDPNLDFMKQYNGRVKTIKMKGCYSQGLVGPLSWLFDRGHEIYGLNVGDDVTEKMGITKYVPSEETSQYQSNNDNTVRVSMPDFIQKTDEDRLQNVVSVLKKINKDNLVITRKEDGTSATYFLTSKQVPKLSTDDQPLTFGVASRRFVLLDRQDKQAYYYFMFHDEIEKNMRANNLIDLAIQGEIVGSKISGNRLAMKDTEFRVFNIWDIAAQSYKQWDDVLDICKTLGLQTVPEITMPDDFELTLKSLLSLSEAQEYKEGIPAEGIVVKTRKHGTNDRVSFKVISNRYLIKHGL
jgi:RNA ligase (TIGR02306 family)